MFDDFVYAARYLVDKGYTTRNQLAIMGGSNGGLVRVGLPLEDDNLSCVEVGSFSFGANQMGGGNFVGFHY